MKKIGIFGYGEVGKAIADLYEENGWSVSVKDLVRDDGLEGCDVIHVAIPYSDSFKTQVCTLVNTLNFKGNLVIHSTVRPGTSRMVRDSLDASKYSGVKVSYSPIRGVHPNLLEGIKTFVKVIAGEGAEEVSAHFISDLKIRTEIFSSTDSAEVAKLLDTSYYGVCIAWHQYGSDICKKLDVPFEEAMTFFNETYNEGYSLLGKNNVIRPVLYPPEGKIGGHCVIPNAEILSSIEEDKLLDAILDIK